MEWQNWLDKKVLDNGKQRKTDDFADPDKSLLLDIPDKTIPRIRSDFDDETHEDPYSTKSWELWLDKNNAIETSHKDEKEKEEWDGKFSSSTIRDDAKDEKSESEEESLEELTDGKLEEVEKLKSWESWLTKYEETKEDKRLALQLDEARAVTGKKVAPQKVKPETGEDAKMGEYSTITAEKFKSWSLWLEKQQGAGDARFGNQHLTGLDQEPVNNEEDEANILPEKEEKTADKREKHEETDDKPYKGLKVEKK